MPGPVLGGAVSLRELYRLYALRTIVSVVSMVNSVLCTFEAAVFGPLEVFRARNRELATLFRYRPREPLTRHYSLAAQHIWRKSLARR